MKVAIVYEWLSTVAGGERVLEQIIECYPQADLYCTVDFLPAEERGFLGGRPVRTSFIQNLPFARKHFRNYLPFMPLAVEQYDLSSYDIVISTHHAVAKGVITGPDQLHVSYIHSPIRYAWDLQQQYLEESGLDKGAKSVLARLILHYLRLWDIRTANGVDAFIANSRFIARRIEKVYRRQSRVIAPPVDVDRFTPGEIKDSYYLAASRMVPYKRMPLIAEAFSRMPNCTLIVTGDGPDLERIRKVVKESGSKNISVLGAVSQEKLISLLQKARAFVFAACEDFGILPVEAMACGTPVIAYGRGGILDTVRGLSDPNPTGVLFPDQTPESLISAVETFERESAHIHPAVCRTQAEKFGRDRFRKEFMDFVEYQWTQHAKQLG
jgi:glycosyltransferase involved in cell wall biosynthesis